MKSNTTASSFLARRLPVLSQFLSQRHSSEQGKLLKHFTYTTSIQPPENGLTGTRMMLGLWCCCRKRRVLVVSRRFAETETAQSFSIKNTEVGTSNTFRNRCPLWLKACPQHLRKGQADFSQAVHRDLSCKKGPGNPHLSHLHLQRENVHRKT